ncbi:hypothetical protein OS121_14190 [Mycolicibacterium mucogenicum]|uniref:hypothetical protein n=1 Tax=Mycolicibacterium mucogenicum TaxID=56689 RepID=UPI00226AE02C|nr:hypothetical protein [Mycolicibacterium mucogenicum]MCX8556226.1 hypothetical protein [Mycolicibacterium mucogenicum]
MLEPAFIIDAVVLFAIGLWPLLLVVTAAGVRWFNARRSAAAAAVHSGVPSVLRTADQIGSDWKG